MNRSDFLNGGAYARTAFQAINQTATAGGAGDATEVDCAWVDRIIDAAAEGGMAMSAKLVISFTATLAEGETLSFAAQMQDATASDGTGVADYEDAVASAVAATGDSGGSTETGTVEIDVDLSHANQFVRSQVTPDLSAGATDTAEWSACLVFFGHNRMPISQSAVTVGSPT